MGRSVDTLLYRGAPLRLAGRYRTVRGLRLHERVGGSGRPLVLLHGIGVSGRYMLPTAGRLAATHHVLVPDLPGFGRSAPPPRPLAVADLADALVAWLDAAGIDRTPLLANSFGCQIAADLAARHPERITRLVLVGPTVDRHARSLVRQAARLALDTAREPIGLWPLATWDYLTFVARGGAPMFLELLRDALEARLPLVGAPTLVVRGARDAIVTQRWAEEVARLLPEGRLLVVPGSAHAVNYHCPAALARAVTTFLV